MSFSERHGTDYLDNRSKDYHCLKDYCAPAPNKKRNLIMKATKRPTSPSSSAFMWINMTIAVILILLCHLSTQVVTARGVVLARRGNGDEGRARAMLERPGINNSPDIMRHDAETQISAGALDALGLSNTDLRVRNSPGNPVGHVRETRAAVYHRKNDDRGLKHVQRIPVSGYGKHSPSPPPPEESYEESLESMEANREAMLELLKDNAKHRHRKKPNKKHSKMILKFDDEAQRWSLTEQQSEEWFV